MSDFDFENDIILIPEIHTPLSTSQFVAASATEAKLVRPSSPTATTTKLVRF